ncbi:MAG TPA: permease [Chloroflexi bacterium]|nr:permease [Chloroflexota bacterium]
MDLNIILDALGRMIASGWMSLLDYLAAHVLLCLMPAFIIAGYMSAMIPKEAITRYLGPRANRWISYPAAAVGGFVLAVCSCTILPLFAGIWKRGAGLGPAITFLFVGPAVNILAIAYTGAAIGMDIALARIVLSIVFGIGIGLTMAWFFRAEEARRSASMAESGIFDQEARVPRVVWALFLLLIGVLIVGTLQVEPLTGTWFSLHLPVTMPEALTQALAGINLNFQGALLIMLLILIAPVACLGLENVLEQFNGWTRLAITLVALTVLVAAPRFAEGSLTIEITGRFVGVLLLLGAVGVVAARSFERYAIAEWLWETWRFVKQIFPLLIVGVFAAGMVKAILPETWIQTLAGRNTLWANLIGVLFGVFMYFPTLVEVPIARMFLDLGMHRGPLLAYLLADPELSLQSILVTGRILGRKKTAVYVSLVTVASTLAGWIFGLLLVTF